MLLTSPWPGLGLHWDNGWVLPPGAYTRHARAAAADAPHAGRLTPASRPPATCSASLLALARLGAPVFGTDAEPCGGCSERPTPASVSFHYVYNTD